jgi:hypothetical protein
MTAAREGLLWTEYVPIDDVVHADRNAQQHDIPGIMASIRQFGFMDQSVIDERTDKLVGGHGRLIALCRMRDQNEPAPKGIDVDERGWLVPISRGWSSRSDVEADAAGVALNRWTERGGKDERALAEILSDVIDYDPKMMDAVGYSAMDLDALLDDLNNSDPLPGPEPRDPLDPDDERERDDDDPPISAKDLDDDLSAKPENQVDPAPIEPQTRTGDVWLCGPHRVVCGDSSDRELLARALNGDRPDIVIADPPYGMRLNTDYRGMRGDEGDARFARWGGKQHKTVEGDHEDYDPRPLLDLLGDVAEQFWWGADYYAERIHGRTEGSWLVWDKRTPALDNGHGSEFELAWSRKRHKRRMLRHPWFGFFAGTGDGNDARNRVHPTQKPVSLYAAILGAWSAAGALMLDPFGGSGTGLIAAEQTGRRAIVIELDPAYVDVILMRFSKHTGNTPVREADGEPFRDVTAPDGA